MNRRHGYTLVEVLAAMIVLATVVGILYALLGDVGDAYREGERRLDDIRLTSAALATFRADARAAQGARMDENSLVLVHAGSGEVRYAWADGRLVRREGDAVRAIPAPWASCRFEVEIVSRCATLRTEPLPRRGLPVSLTVAFRGSP